MSEKYLNAAWRKLLQTFTYDSEEVEHDENIIVNINKLALELGCHDIAAEDVT